MAVSVVCRRLALLTSLYSGAIFSAGAAELTVSVAGIEADKGEIGCALYPGPEGFPMDDSFARVQWQDAKRGGVDCRFDGLAPGSYAVAVSHDFNGNKRTDTNFLGIPTEPWGVSKNVRPTLRAPRFDEAALELNQDSTMRVIVTVSE